MNKFVGYEKESKSGRNWAFPALLIGHRFLSQRCLLMKIVLAKILVDYLVYLCQLLVCGKLPSLSLDWPPASSLIGLHSRVAVSRYARELWHTFAIQSWFSDPCSVRQ